MQDAALGIEGLAVTITNSGGIKAVCQFILGFGRAEGLILENYDMVLVECVANEGEVIVCRLQSVLYLAFFESPNTYLGGYRSTECSLR